MCQNRQESADLATFTKEIPNGELHFSCIVLIDSSVFLKKGC